MNSLIRATGRGPVPGIEPLEANRTIFEDFAEGRLSALGLPFLAQLPARGAGSDAVGRTASFLDQMPIEIGPHGWKLTDRPGADLSRTVATLREDLAALGFAGLGYNGELTLSVLGPWTLASQLYTARGDRVLADLGAVTDLAEALTEGIRRHILALREELPQATRLTIQVDEPLLGQVAAGVLPTFSGANRIRAVEFPNLVEHLEVVIRGLDTGVDEQVGATGVCDVVVHSGKSLVAFETARSAGARAVGFEPGAWDEVRWTRIAEEVEAGMVTWASLPAAQVSQCAGPDLPGVADGLWTPWRRIGLPAKALAGTVILEARNSASAGNRVPSRPSRDSAGGQSADRQSADWQQTRNRFNTILRTAEILNERAELG